MIWVIIISHKKNHTRINITRIISQINSFCCMLISPHVSTCKGHAVRFLAVWPKKYLYSWAFSPIGWQSPLNSISNFSPGSKSMIFLQHTEPLFPFLFKPVKSQRQEILLLWLWQIIKLNILHKKLTTTRNAFMSVDFPTILTSYLFSFILQI